MTIHNQPHDPPPSEDPLLTAIAILEAFIRQDTAGYETLIDNIEDHRHTIGALCQIATDELQATTEGHALDFLAKARKHITDD